MDAFTALQALSEGNLKVIDGLPSKRHEIPSVDVLLVASLGEVMGQYGGLNSWNKQQIAFWWIHEYFVTRNSKYIILYRKRHD